MSNEPTIQFPPRAFGLSVFERDYRNYTSRFENIVHQTGYIINGIRKLHELNPHEYSDHDLDHEAWAPVAYNEFRGTAEEIKWPGIPAWLAIIIGRKSDHKMIKLSGQPWGRYALRQSLVYTQHDDGIFPHVYGELILGPNQRGRRQKIEMLMPPTAERIHHAARFVSDLLNRSGNENLLDFNYIEDIFPELKQRGLSSA